MDAVLWILLMFTSPQEQGGMMVRSLGVYTDPNTCQQQLQRGMEIIPKGVYLSCVPTKKPTLT